MRDKKVILFRSRGIDPAIHKIASSLGDAGYNVDLILWDRAENVIINSSSLSYSTVRIKLPAPYDSILTPFAWPIWWALESIYLIRKRYSIIHATDFDTVIPAFIFSKIRKVPFFYTIYDYYSANIPQDRKFLRHLISKMENFFIHRADCLFIVDENRLEQFNGCKIKDLAVIYNSPIDVTPDHGARTTNFSLFYAGALLKSRGIGFLIDLAKEMPDVDFIFAGSGPEEKNISNVLKKHSNIQFLGQIPYPNVIQSSQKADMLIALYDPQIENNRYASPNKLFEAMMLAKPIIASNSSSIKKIIDSERCGVIVDYGNINQLRDAILMLSNSPDLCKSLGQNGRIAYERKYSWDIMKQRILKKYSSALNNLEEYV